MKSNGSAANATGARPGGKGLSMGTRNILLLTGGTVVLVVLLLAAGARSDPASLMAEIGGASEAATAEVAELDRLARRAGVRVDDFLAYAAPPPGVTAEELAAARARRWAEEDPELIRANVRELRQRLEWAVEYAARQRPPEQFPPSSTDVASPEAAATAPSSDACWRYCTLLRRCNGPEERGEWAGCLAACGRGDFGTETRLSNIASADTCEHL
jgi:hypothetical protein